MRDNYLWFSARFVTISQSFALSSRSTAFTLIPSRPTALEFYCQCSFGLFDCVTINSLLPNSLWSVLKCDRLELLCPGGVLPYITYTGMCRPTGSWFWSSWFRTGYPFQRLLLERGIIFRTHGTNAERSSFVSSHLKLFKDWLLLKIRFNESTSKLLYPCCTLERSIKKLAHF